jgi:hypothetical protein
LTKPRRAGTSNQRYSVNDFTSPICHQSRGFGKLESNEFANVVAYSLVSGAQNQSASLVSMFERSSRQAGWLEMVESRLGEALNVHSWRKPGKFASHARVSFYPGDAG